MAKKNYRSYVLVAKKGNEIIEIDWTKVKSFSDCKKKKYKLEQIDYFTTHFVSKEELVNFLIKSEIVSEDDLKGASFWIYPAVQNSVTKIIDGKSKKVSAPIYAKEQLQYGIAYANVEKFLTEDSYPISFLQSKLDDYDFICNLYNKYVKNGKYSQRLLDNAIIQERIARDDYYNSGNPKYDAMRKSYTAQRIKIQESHSLLESVMNYAAAIKRGEVLDTEALESARNNIKEFFLREKYTVIGCKDGLYDNRELEYKKNKDGSIAIDYLNFHKLVLFIAKELSNEEKKNEEIKSASVKSQTEKNESSKNGAKRKIIKRANSKEVEGQLNLFDYFGIENPQKKR